VQVLDAQFIGGYFVHGQVVFHDGSVGSVSSVNCVT
jgi:hypothetical protein